jgi:hypothetical protein
MSDNLTGNVYGQRQASAEVVHTYVVPFNATGISSGILLDTIRASADKPVHIEHSVSVVTAFNAGTTNVLTFGTSSVADEWYDASAITEGTPGYYPSSNAVGKLRVTSDTKIYARFAQTGTAATTGLAILIVKEFQENTRAIS